MAGFKAGDVVQLKSGGPKMTVYEVKGETVFCEWFNEKGEVKSRRFPLAVLKGVK